MISGPRHYRRGRTSSAVIREAIIHVGGAATAEQALAYYREDAFGRVLFGNAEPAKQAAAADALLEELEKHQSADGVQLRSAAWVVTATAA